MLTQTIKFHRQFMEEKSDLNDVSRGNGSQFFVSIFNSLIDIEFQYNDSRRYHGAHELKALEHDILGFRFPKFTTKTH